MVNGTPYLGHLNVASHHTAEYGVLRYRYCHCWGRSPVAVLRTGCCNVDCFANWKADEE